jgi:hypothetical protein
VLVGVCVGVGLAVFVGVLVGVTVGVFVGVAVGVLEGVTVGVAVGGASTMMAPTRVDRASAAPFGSARSTAVIVIALVPGARPMNRIDARTSVPVKGGAGFSSDTE